VPARPLSVQYVATLYGYVVTVENKVPTLRDLIPGATVQPLDFESPPGWSRFNPTIAPVGTGFHVIVRSANYMLLGRGKYRYMDGGDRVLTCNYLLTLDGDFHVHDIQPLVDRSQGPPRYPSWAVGYEDCRLVYLSHSALATCTVCDRNPAQRPEIAILELQANAVTRVTVLRGPDPARPEKNWMPFVRSGSLHLLYSCDPTTVFECDVASGRLSIVSKQAAPREAVAFRGSSQGIPFEGGSLFVVHEPRVAGKAYRHRFVVLDREGAIAAFSPAFCFLGAEVEFCAGLARTEGAFVLTFGVGDCSAWIAVVDVEECVRLLQTDVTRRTRVKSGSER
jgi:predicted GH43/DUF377 family glycosyl hydrolase